MRNLLKVINSGLVKMTGDKQLARCLRSYDHAKIFHPHSILNEIML